MNFDKDTNEPKLQILLGKHSCEEIDLTELLSKTFNLSKSKVKRLYKQEARININITWENK